jgi:hypothetical protein
VSVRISGGLGNQMFQYAAARALAARLGVPLALDLSFFGRRRHRAYGLDRLPLAPHQRMGTEPGWIWRCQAWWQRLTGRSAPVYQEPHFHVDPAFFALHAPVHLVGHFQSARYFEHLAGAIAQELEPPAADDALSLRLAALAEHTDTCALHVRRGDYLSSAKNRALFAACDRRYYDQALERLPTPCTVLVFSDDMAWCRDQFGGRPGIQFVDDGQPRAALADLWLMTRTRHQVIANSSLSWWGAWLSRAHARAGLGRPPGQTIAPRHWFVDAAYDDRDLVPADWTRL